MPNSVYINKQSTLTMLREHHLSRPEVHIPLKSQLINNNQLIKTNNYRQTSLKHYQTLHESRTKGVKLINDLKQVIILCEKYFK